jgi:hypothetical protein
VLSGFVDFYLVRSSYFDIFALFRLRKLAKINHFAQMLSKRIKSDRKALYKESRGP